MQRLQPTIIKYFELNQNTTDEDMLSRLHSYARVRINPGAHAKHVRLIPFTVVGLSAGINPELLQHLPKQVYAVNLHAGVNEELIKNLPSHIIQVNFLEKISPKAIKNLPQQITTVAIHPGIDGEMTRALPKQVVRVIIQGIIDPSAIRELPRSVSEIDTLSPFSRVHINDYNTLNNFAQKYCTIIYKGNVIRAATTVTPIPMSPATASTLKRANPEGEVGVQSTPSQASKIVRLPGNALQPLLQSLSIFSSLEFDNSFTEADTVANEAKQTSVSPGRK